MKLLATLCLVIFFSFNAFSNNGDCELLDKNLNGFHPVKYCSLFNEDDCKWNGLYFISKSIDLFFKIYPGEAGNSHTLNLQLLDDKCYIALDGAYENEWFEVVHAELGLDSSGDPSLNVSATNNGEVIMIGPRFVDGIELK